ncbi:hypothetical protein PENSPDRAFT_467987 [Peniophora sp. CONT]|nr:hypothetical protein PENSPDRAFT_467987 [Peniophora sp. CONT]
MLSPTLLPQLSALSDQGDHKISLRGHDVEAIVHKPKALQDDPLASASVHISHLAGSSWSSIRSDRHCRCVISPRASRTQRAAPKDKGARLCILVWFGGCAFPSGPDSTCVCHRRTDNCYGGTVPILATPLKLLNRLFLHTGHADSLLAPCPTYHPSSTRLLSLSNCIPFSAPTWKHWSRLLR